LLDVPRIGGPFRHLRWLGRFPWTTIAPVSILVPFSLFLLFEIWFLVPLPKGPLEDFLGY